MAKNDSLVVMRALVLTDQGVRYRDDWPEPLPASGDVLVRVLRAGICDTDLQLVQGYKGFTGILGHEFVGVAQSGPLAGQRVVGEINCSCWECETCRAGRPGHCPSRSVLGILDRDGAFADLVAVPQRNLHAVPDSISTDVAVFVEPVAAAFEIPSQVRINPNDRIVILGDGRLGNLCAQVLAGISDRVIVIGKHQEKLAIIRSMGVETCMLDGWSSTGGADIVVDCTGSPTGLSTALAIVRPRGTIVLKTTLAGTQTANWSSVVVDEVTIVGSRCGPFDRAIEALSDGTVDVAPLISERYPLSEGVVALARAGAGSVLKVLLEVS